MFMVLGTEIRLGRKVEPSYQTVNEVTHLVQEGGIVVFPWGKLERRCLALMCDSLNVEACYRVNRIKTRPEDQVLAVNGYPQLIAEIAKIEDSRPLVAAGERLGVEPVEIIRRTMVKGAISFIFEARDGIPDTVTQKTGGINTVMVAGEIDNTGFDFYIELIRGLHRKDIVTAGTSANRTANGTYNVFEQDKAYNELAPHVDLFVYHHNLGPRPIHALNLESCSTFDMTVDSNVPRVVRFGSVNPVRFRGIVGDYSVSPKAQYLPCHETWQHMLLKFPLRLLRGAA